MCQRVQTCRTTCLSQHMDQRCQLFDFVGTGIYQVDHLKIVYFGTEFKQNQASQQIGSEQIFFLLHRWKYKFAVSEHSIEIFPCSVRLINCCAPYHGVSYKFEWSRKNHGHVKCTLHLTHTLNPLNFAPKHTKIDILLNALVSKSGY